MWDLADVSSLVLLYFKSAYTDSEGAASELRQIWDLADVSRDGKLDKHEYVLAMHFIQCRQRGEVLPAAIPAGMLAAPPAGLALSSVGGSPNPATLPTVPTSVGGGGGGGGGGMAVASPLVHSLTHVGFPEASA